MVSDNRQQLQKISDIRNIVTQIFELISDDVKTTLNRPQTSKAIGTIHRNIRIEDSIEIRQILASLVTARLFLCAGDIFLLRRHMNRLCNILNGIHMKYTINCVCLRACPSLLVRFARFSPFPACGWHISHTHLNAVCLCVLRGVNRRVHRNIHWQRGRVRDRHARYRTAEQSDERTQAGENTGQTHHFWCRHSPKTLPPSHNSHSSRVLRVCQWGCGCCVCMLGENIESRGREYLLRQRRDRWLTQEYEYI